MRNLFQKKLKDDNNIVIRNPLSIDWGSFPYQAGYTLYKLTDFDIVKPYLISLNAYGTVDFEDIILLLNNIEDIFECIPGKEIKLPNLNELKSWLAQYQNQF